MAVPIKKGVEYDCPMFDVRCKQPCASGGVRHTEKCPYDNYRKDPKSQKVTAALISKMPTAVKRW